MKRGVLLCAAMVTALLMLALPALAGGFDGLTPPTILSFDPETLAITWDEPDADTGAWDYLGYYSLRIYYADHALTEEEWPSSELEVPVSLTFVSSQRIGAKNSPSGVVSEQWLSKGNGFYYFAISAMTTSGDYIYSNEGGEVQVVMAASHIEGVRICHTPYELAGVESLPAPTDIRYEAGVLRWKYDQELFSKAQFYYCFSSTAYYANGSRLHSVRYDEEAGEACVDIVTGDNNWNLSPNKVYGLALWAKPTDTTQYGESEKAYAYSILRTAADRLPSPEGITFDNDDLTLRWDAVDSSCVYEYGVSVYMWDGVSDSITRIATARTADTEISLNAYALKYGAGTYYAVIRTYSGDFTVAMDGSSISIPSLSDVGAWDEVAHGTITISDTPLPTISWENVVWGPDGYLRWESVEGAAYYEYQVYTRSSADDPYPTNVNSISCSIPAYGLSIPSTITEKVIQLKVRAVSADAKRYVNGEWSDFSPAFTYTAAPAMPGLTSKKYNKADRTITWDPVTGEDAAYLGGYVVELCLYRDSSLGRMGWTILTQNTSISIDEFADFFTDVEPGTRVVYSVWAYSSDLTARNHGSNSTGTFLPEGVMPQASPAPSVEIAHFQYTDGGCSFTVCVYGAGDQDRVFVAVYEADGRLRNVRTFTARESTVIFFPDVTADNVIKVMLTDPGFIPLVPAITAS